MKFNLLMSSCPVNFHLAIHSLVSQLHLFEVLNLISCILSSAFHVTSRRFKFILIHSLSGNTWPDSQSFEGPRRSRFVSGGKYFADLASNYNSHADDEIVGGLLSSFYTDFWDKNAKRLKGILGEIFFTTGKCRHCKIRMNDKQMMILMLKVIMMMMVMMMMIMIMMLMMMMVMVVGRGVRYAKS